jgi:hypothetical protein
MSPNDPQHPPLISYDGGPLVCGVALWFQVEKNSPYGSDA